jgi:hypothetical protein
MLIEDPLYIQYIIYNSIFAFSAYAHVRQTTIRLKNYIAAAPVSINDNYLTTILKCSNIISEKPARNELWDLIYHSEDYFDSVKNYSFVIMAIEKECGVDSSCFANTYNSYTSYNSRAATQAAIIMHKHLRSIIDWLTNGKYVDRYAIVNDYYNTYLYKKDFYADNAILVIQSLVKRRDNNYDLDTLQEPIDIIL